MIHCSFPFPNHYKFVSQALQIKFCVTYDWHGEWCVVGGGPGGGGGENVVNILSESVHKIQLHGKTPSDTTLVW
jgi:hypothetical protein